MKPRWNSLQQLNWCNGRDPNWKKVGIYLEWTRRGDIEMNWCFNGCDTTVDTILGGFAWSGKQKQWQLAFAHFCKQEIFGGLDIAWPWMGEPWCRNQMLTVVDREWRVRKHSKDVTCLCEKDMSLCYIMILQYAVSQIRPIKITLVKKFPIPISSHLRYIKTPKPFNQKYQYQIERCCEILSSHCFPRVTNRIIQQKTQKQQ